MKQKNYHGDSGRCDGDVTVVKKTWPPVMSREGPTRPRRFCDTARCLVGTRYCRLTCKCRNRIPDNRPITTSNRMFFFFVVRPARTIPNAFWPRSGSGKEEFLPRRRLGVFLGQGQSRAAQSRSPASVASTFGASGRLNLSPPGPSRRQKTWTVNARLFQSQPGLPPEASGTKGRACARALYCAALQIIHSRRRRRAEGWMSLGAGCGCSRGSWGRVARAGRQAVASPVQPGLGGEGEGGGGSRFGVRGRGGMCCLLASVSVTEWKRHGF